MDDLSLYCSVENLFGNLKGKSFASRHKRHKLVESIKIKINALSIPGQSTEKAECENVVTAIILYHRKTIGRNRRECIFTKYHNLLYVAVKLCFDFRLTGSTVAELLKEIFRCEKSFERIFGGALYGVTVAHFTTSWKSDFRDQKENILAIAYFLQEAALQKLQFPVRTDSGTKMKKFVDLNINLYGTPLKIAMQMENTEMVLLLLRFDASMSFRFFDIYPRGAGKTEEEMKCVKILFRAAPSISKLDRQGSRYEDWNSVRSLSPLGLVPPQLKHLCRCEIRNALRKNSMLPLGIAKFGLPKSLSDYLDLLYD